MPGREASGPECGRSRGQVAGGDAALSGGLEAEKQQEGWLVGILTSPRIVSLRLLATTVTAATAFVMVLVV